MEKEKKRKATDKLKSYLNRCGNKTPPFFKKLRLAGLIVAAVGTTILAAPIALPAIALSIAGYLATAGAIATAVSQSAIADDEDCEEDEK